ncbi:dihydroxyacetone kinase subunit DhaK [Salipiger thiooxidans]|uniref:dihydroxyacetone kinase subunit DhaK n=1 Tax=Salipiger thiooxidans TaxID=282683 RepID=UPI001CD1A5A7|nr:dihydroxyacetone kinase subunit DhaK [Salipiger thiooxidans]MCA0846254.1 dihydroxyacetone kinase subunit DhaK [Salipiger thiooxidans]
MSQFINLTEDIVAEAVDGVVSASGGRLARLDGYPHIRVVLRADWDKAGVALVSGGGSGQEPAQAGFVGAGMLTSAICGDVFASPSVDGALVGILEVTGPAGSLLIVKNDTGDRLNFGLAAERVRAFGLNVALVVAMTTSPRPTCRRRATLFVHKIAGTLAENGADRTATMEAAKAGRSAYINADQLKGEVDPGAEAVARLFESLAAWARDGTGDAPALRSARAT